MKSPTAVSTFLALFCSSTAAHAAALVGTMLIDPGIINATSGTYTSGSYFTMGANNPNSSSAVMLSPGSAGGIVLGTYQNFVLNPDVPHPFNWDGLGANAGTGYSGSPSAQGTAVAPFFFFYTATYAGTNPIAYQSGDAHPAPTADISNCIGTSCTLSMELSAWEVMWNGSAFEQGPRPANTGPFVLAMGTYDTATQGYSLTWDSQINGGPFNGVRGYWHLEGTVVPLPAAAWLLGSGLLGLLAVARRKSRE